jgi:hypothetical protein
MNPKTARKTTLSRGTRAGSRSDAACASILSDIQSGRYRVGDFLPPVRELAVQFGGSITPVVQALKQLETQGIVDRIHGSGVRVAKITGAGEPLRGAIVAIPAMRPLREYDVTETRLNRHVSHASEGWIINRLLHQEDIRIQLSPLKYRESDDSFVRILEQLLEAPPHALCFATPPGFSDRALVLLRRLESRNVRVAMLVSDRDVPEFDRIVMDFALGQYELTRYLLSVGHKSLLRLCSLAEYDWEQKKQQGYIRALAEAGYPGDYASKTCLNFGVVKSSGAEVVGAAVRFIGTAIDTFSPTVIMACDDTHAALIRVVLRFLGRTDILVTGYDNKWAEMDDPDPFHLGNLGGVFPEDLAKENPPISVECNRAEAGVALAKLVLDRLHGVLPEEKQVVVIGQSLVVPQKEKPRS